MSDLVRIIEYRDDIDSKCIKFEFTRGIKKIVELKLFNIEITENGEKEAVELPEKNKRYGVVVYSAGKHEFVFESGRTLFNDGAKIEIIVIEISKSEEEQYSFVFKDNNWVTKEDVENGQTNK